MATVLYTWIGVYKNFYFGVKPILQRIFEMVNFIVYPGQFPVVWKSQMAVDMEVGSVFLYA